MCVKARILGVDLSPQSYEHIDLELRHMIRDKKKTTQDLNIKQETQDMTELEKRDKPKK